MIGRRALLAMLAFWPLAARAQAPGRIYRMGAVILAPRVMIDHALEALRGHGFVEGKNLLVDAEGFGLSADDLDRHVQDLVRQRVDVIWAGGDPAIAAILRATTTIPVLAVSEDLVASGFARSLAAPGGSVTGISLLSPELDSKRLDLFIDMLPDARHLTALVEAGATPPTHIAALQAGARRRGVELAIENIGGVPDLALAFERAQREGTGGLLVLMSALLFGLRAQTLALEARHRLPVMHQWPASVRAGGLVGYNADLPKLYRAVLTPTLARLLNGESPANIPIQQPTTFELVVNLKTAGRLGLSVPASFLARADEVIE